MYVALELIHYLLFLGGFLKFRIPTATAREAIAPTLIYTAVRFPPWYMLSTLEIMIRNAANISKYLAIRIFVSDNCVR